MGHLTKLEVLAASPVWEWPDEARAWIVEGLRGADVDARRSAIPLAARLYDDDGVVGLLIDLLERDPVDEIRAAAAIATGPALEGFATRHTRGVRRATFERACRVLEAIYRDLGQPDEVRRRALEGAVRAPQPWQVAEIRAACDATEPAWQATGVFCAGQHPVLVDLALARIDSPEPAVRLEAFRVAADYGVHSELPRFLAVAADRGADRELRLAAIEGLGATASPRSVKVLQALRRSTDEGIAGAAAEALERVVEILDVLDDDD